MDCLVVDHSVKELGRDIADYPGGIVIPVDKPYRWTSADAIRKIKYAAIRHFGKKNLKVGHAGTLDPLATGILIICIGNATKRAQEFQDHDKEYIAGVSFGAVTPSYDLEKDISQRFEHSHINEERIKAVLQGFVGEQDQVAPLFSAKSVDGVRAYEMARKALKEGRPVEDDILRSSRIKINSCNLLEFKPYGITQRETLEEDSASRRINVAQGDPNLPAADILIGCSKGTYIRAFARDLGERLESGAYLNALRRSRSGDFRIENALSIEEVLELL